MSGGEVLRRCLTLLDIGAASAELAGEVADLVAVVHGAGVRERYSQQQRAECCEAPHGGASDPGTGTIDTKAFRRKRGALRHGEWRRAVLGAANATKSTLWRFLDDATVVGRPSWPQLNVSKLFATGIGARGA